MRISAGNSFGKSPSNLQGAWRDQVDGVFAEAFEHFRQINEVINSLTGDFVATNRLTTLFDSHEVVL
jgi:hypothetical protein